MILPVEEPVGEAMAPGFAGFCDCSPSMTARTSRVTGRKVPAWFITQSLSGLAGTDPNGRQGGRKRQRPLTAPSGGPGSTPMVPQSTIAGVAGGIYIDAVQVDFPRATPLGSTSVSMPSKRVRITASPAPRTVNPPVPMIVTSVMT